jgi:hypothetical protein
MIPYTRLANELIDDMLDGPAGEMRILLAVARNTVGREQPAWSTSWRRLAAHAGTSLSATQTAVHHLETTGRVETHLSARTHQLTITLASYYWPKKNGQDPNERLLTQLSTP